MPDYDVHPGTGMGTITALSPWPRAIAGLLLVPGAQQKSMAKVARFFICFGFDVVGRSGVTNHDTLDSSSRLQSSGIVADSVEAER
jgi:hypothetical protein